MSVKITVIVSDNTMAALHGVTDLGRALAIPMDTTDIDILVGDGVTTVTVSADYESPTDLLDILTMYGQTDFGDSDNIDTGGTT